MYTSIHLALANSSDKSQLSRDETFNAHVDVQANNQYEQKMKAELIEKCFVVCISALYREMSDLNNMTQKQPLWQLEWQIQLYSGSLCWWCWTGVVYF